MSGLIGFLIVLLVLAVVIWAIRQIIPMIGIPEPIGQIVIVIVGLIGLLYALNRLGFGFGL